ncbi:uncharacterized protein LOC115261639 [Aedes albopictus]|uniref:Uncharacterized protein n=1 Tax=Aedes albopictus TaxID=7160 RepID=A0ABM1ZJ79_AEDAL
MYGSKNKMNLDGAAMLPGPDPDFFAGSVQATPSVGCYEEVVTTSNENETELSFRNVETSTPKRKSNDASKSNKHSRLHPSNSNSFIDPPLRTRLSLSKSMPIQTLPEIDAYRGFVNPPLRNRHLREFNHSADPLLPRYPFSVKIEKQRNELQTADSNRHKMEIERSSRRLPLLDRSLGTIRKSQVSGENRSFSVSGRRRDSSLHVSVDAVTNNERYRYGKINNSIRDLHLHRTSVRDGEHRKGEEKLKNQSYSANDKSQVSVKDYLSLAVGQHQDLKAKSFCNSLRGNSDRLHRGINSEVGKQIIRPDISQISNNSSLLNGRCAAIDLSQVPVVLDKNNDSLSSVARRSDSKGPPLSITHASSSNNLIRDTTAIDLSCRPTREVEQQRKEVKLSRSLSESYWRNESYTAGNVSKLSDSSSVVGRHQERRAQLLSRNPLKDINGNDLHRGLQSEADRRNIRSDKLQASNNSSLLNGRFPAIDLLQLSSENGLHRERANSSHQCVCAASRSNSQRFESRYDQHYRSAQEIDSHRTVVKKMRGLELPLLDRSDDAIDASQMSINSDVSNLSWSQMRKHQDRSPLRRFVDPFSQSRNSSNLGLLKDDRQRHKMDSPRTSRMYYAYNTSNTTVDTVQDPNFSYAYDESSRKLRIGKLYRNVSRNLFNPIWSRENIGVNPRHKQHGEFSIHREIHSTSYDSARHSNGTDGQEAIIDLSRSSRHPRQELANEMAKQKANMSQDLIGLDLRCQPAGITKPSLPEILEHVGSDGIGSLVQNGEPDVFKAVLDLNHRSACIDSVSHASSKLAADTIIDAEPPVLVEKTLCDPPAHGRQLVAKYSLILPDDENMSTNEAHVEEQTEIGVPTTPTRLNTSITKLTNDHTKPSDIIAAEPVMQQKCTTDATIFETSEQLFPKPTELANEQIAICSQLQISSNQEFANNARQNCDENSKRNDDSDSEEFANNARQNCDENSERNDDSDSEHEDLDDNAHEIQIGDLTLLNEFIVDEYFEKYTNQTLINDDDEGEKEHQESSPTHSPADVELNNGDLGFEELNTNSPPKKKNLRIVIRNSRMRGLQYTRADGVVIPARSVKPPCSCSKYKCYEKYSEEIRQKLLKNLLKLTTSGQNQFISNHFSIRTTARPKGLGHSRRVFTRSYFLPAVNGRIHVCKEMFSHTLDVKDKKIRVLADKKVVGLGITADDLRSNNRSQKALHESDLVYIEQHIRSFPAYTSHYARERSDKLYLSSDLSISRMHELYKIKCLEDNKQPVQYNTYRKMFKKLNISFRKLKVDTCCKCDKFAISLKLATEDERPSIEKARERHHAEADEPYLQKKRDVLKAKSDIRYRTATFDLQKCLPTPYLSTGIAFYKRQLYTYNLGPVA